MWAANYDCSQGELINLSQGVPGAPPPAELQHRLQEAAADPATTSYGPIAGDHNLRVALAKDINSTYGTDSVTEQHVNITAGCNMVSNEFGPSQPPACTTCTDTRPISAAQAFYAAMITLCRKGDEVILPAPWYFNHEYESRSSQPPRHSLR